MTAATFTLFPDQFAATMLPVEADLDYIATLVRSTARPSKAGLPWVKLAAFGDKPSARKCLRYDANVIAIMGVEGDYDAELVSIDEAGRRLAAVGIDCLLYETASSTSSRPRWRVLAPTAQTYRGDLLHELRQTFLARINGALGGILAPESFDLSRAFYFGSIAGKPPVRVIRLHGAKIDTIEGLPEIYRAGRDRASAKSTAAPVDEPAADSASAYVEGARAYLATLARDGTDPGRWHIATALVRNFGLTNATATELWEASGLRIESHNSGNTLQDKIDHARIYGSGRLGDGVAYDTWRETQADGATAAGTFGHLSEIAPAAPEVKAKDKPATGDFVVGSEASIGADFADQYHSAFKFVVEHGWLVRDGTCWRRDKIFSPWAKIKPIAFAHARQLSKRANRRSIVSSSSINGALNQARSDPRIITEITQWDADPGVMNTPGCAVPLLPSAPSTTHRELFMKSTSVVPSNALHPTWSKFLIEVTDGDVALQEFLQRMAGYFLTGSVKEQKMFFCYGTGRNGKGVFLRTLAAVMGDYAVIAPTGMFEETAHPAHPTELARLKGARLVIGEETGENKYWDVTKIKALTGADPITARFMRQDFTTFAPQFKVIIAGNNKPRLRSVDVAIRERILLLPFTVSFAGAPDLDLETKLAAEHGAILQWAIDGCREWQRIGLAPPPAIRRATAEYLGSQDLFTLWLDECCGLDPDAHTPTADLFRSWCAYRRQGGEPDETLQAFSNRLAKAGYAPSKAPTRAQTRGYKGLRLLATDEDMQAPQAPQAAPPHEHSTRVRACEDHRIFVPSLSP